MIAGRDTHIHSACFDEIDFAVSQIGGYWGEVCFNAHVFPEQVYSGDIVYNFENIPTQVDPTIWLGHRVWDFSARNCERYPKDMNVKHVPVGYHPSMERFCPREPDIDVVFCGTLNLRRVRVLQELKNRGCTVVHVPHGVYGAERDSYLARARVAINMLYYEDGVFPALRTAHLLANKVLTVNETSPDVFPYVVHVPYEDLVNRTMWFLGHSQATRNNLAELDYLAFKRRPMVLPS